MSYYSETSLMSTRYVSVHNCITEIDLIIHVNLVGAKRSKQAKKSAFMRIEIVNDTYHLPRVDNVCCPVSAGSGCHNEVFVLRPLVLYMLWPDSGVGRVRDAKTK